MLTNLFQRSTVTAGAVALASLSGLAAAVPAQAAGISFDTWAKFGDVIQYSTGETEMSTDAFRHGEDTLFPPATGFGSVGSYNFSGTAAGAASDLAGFLGVAPNSLDIGGTAIEGSAIKKTLTVQAGDKFSFSYDFGTNEKNPVVRPVPDYALFTVNGAVTKLADIFNAPAPAVNAPFYADTGLKTFSYTFASAGTYTLGLGVLDVVDGFETSGLYLNDATLTPVPAPSLLAPLVVMGVNAIRRNRKKSEA
jgi:hypothetical protein